ncbi:MAG TPA: tRNA pseudouridine(13) synthase TruD [Myxococcota bacterium]|nr:tRNA pseudouridine(13) synthase TruD [Myxococcota bacterium]
MRLLPGAEYFRVTELPAYEPEGAGEHLWLLVEKEQLNTDDVIDALARAARRPRRDVGYAGRKDRNAVARQWFSVRLGDEKSLAELKAPGGRLEVVSVSRHRNKLRLGHLQGNRFRLGLGDVEPAGRTALCESLERLAHAGLENRFGAQRFGSGELNLALARAWAAGDLARTAALCVDSGGAWRAGEPLPSEYRPGLFGRVVGALRRAPEDPAGALRAAGPSFRKLVASAAQSAVFNAVLEARRATGLTHALRAGDVARRRGGGLFRCTAADAADASRRAAPGLLEVLATGPLPGPDMYAPSAEVTREERAWSAATGFDWEAFAGESPLASPGDRRELVVPFLEPPRLDEPEPAGVTWLEFALPPGSFATELLDQCGVAGRSPTRPMMRDT